MNWLTIVQAVTALYLIGGALLIETENLQSRIMFKLVPMALGLPLAFAVVAQLRGWPL